MYHADAVVCEYKHNDGLENERRAEMTTGCHDAYIMDHDAPALDNQLDTIDEGYHF